MMGSTAREARELDVAGAADYCSPGSGCYHRQLIGVGMLFYDAKAMLGWLLAGGGPLVIFAGIIANLEIHFRTTSLFNTLVMLGLIMAGLGLMARALKAAG